ncbi:hypothetical protein DFO67_10429 [Modicisalibacter xianhensis]|uniref:Type II toxin-antitoxin system RelE/ParE family toxin n=1 Tax=Modicisalibacter xianhensis TaxID=442341 RepID=A0A4R8FVE3_9GAMM|nr:hypothetical protein [Halomonas xianhensis]TDX30774.1 hypothetical protein DFO67_10429 [Halomonas xianhensis]
MKLSRHAKQRWEERCQGLNPHDEWQRAQRVGKPRLKRIKESCPHNAHKVRRDSRDFYYRVSRHSNVVWVVATGPECEVVTVWRWE